MLCVVSLLPSPARSSPAPRAVTVYSAPGCATTKGAPPGRRVSVQQWVLRGRGAQSSLEGLPWGHYLCPLAWSSWAFPGGLWEGKVGDSRLDAESWLRGGGFWNTPGLTSPGYATAKFFTSVLLPDQLRPGGRFRGCEPVRGVPITVSVTRV